MAQGQGKPKGARTYPDEVFEAALQQTLGNKSAAARIIGCQRQTVIKWVEHHPGAVDYVNACKARGEQIALGNIYEGMTTGNLHDRVRASTWYLRFVCKYASREEVDLEHTGFAERLIAELERKRANGHDRSDSLQ